jgi:hypothetical protein
VWVRFPSPAPILESGFTLTIEKIGRVRETRDTGNFEPLLACISVVLKRRDIVEDRIDAGVEKVHHFMGLKRAIATLFSLGPQNIKLRQCGDGVISRCECNA